MEKQLPKLDDIQGIWDYSRNNIAGFNSLIDVVQGMIVGWIIATENFVSTPNMTVTLKFVDEMVSEFNHMSNAWGFQK